METAEQLRQRAADLREAGLHAEGSFGDADIAEAKRLEHRADLLEGKKPDEAKRLRIQLDLKDELIDRLQARICWLEAIISNQIGQPMKELSKVKLAFKLDEVREQRQRLADGISKASTLADLQNLQLTARNMGLIDKRNQFQKLAGLLGQA